MQINSACCSRTVFINIDVWKRVLIKYMWYLIACPQLRNLVLILNLIFPAVFHSDPINTTRLFASQLTLKKNRRTFLFPYVLSTCVCRILVRLHHSELSQVGTGYDVLHRFPPIWRHTRAFADSDRIIAGGTRVVNNMENHGAEWGSDIPPKWGKCVHSPRIREKEHDEGNRKE